MLNTCLLCHAKTMGHGEDLAKFMNKQAKFTPVYYI